MRKFLIAAAVSASAMVAAAPAAAQYYPQPQQPYGYGNDYGYNNQQGLVRSYIVRVDQLRQRVERNDSRDRISEREARRLRNEAVDLQRRVRAYAQNGLNGRERYELDRRIAGLQQALRYERNDGNNRGQWRDRDNDGRWDARDGFVDRNRNGVDDRYENRGRYPG